MQLYPFQNTGVNNIRESFRNNKRVLYVAPTGSGKTVTFSYICAKAIEKGSTVLVLSDRVEIFKQNLRSVSKHNIKACLIDAKNKRIDPESKLFFGMVETFKRRINLFKNIKIDLIIVDEAHKQVYYKVFDSFPDVKTLGVTATPVGKKLHLYYNTLIQSIDIPELIEHGFLSSCIGYQMQDDFSDLQTDNSGEFTEQSNFEHFSKARIYDGLIDKYLEKAHGKKTLVFCVNIEHCIQTAKAFNAAGIKAYCLTSETSDTERAWILNEYGKSFTVLINANILVAGFDDPSIEVVIFNRATNSLPVWLQGCGRGSRIFPGKTHFMVLDFGGNFSRHGLWSQPREWSLTPPKKKKKGIGAVPIRECKSCGAMLPAQQRKCNFCGFEISEKEAELLKGQLVEVAAPKGPPPVNPEVVGRKISDLSVSELIELETSKAIKPVYCWRVLRSKGEASIIEYANAKKYKNSWIWRQTQTMAEEQMDHGSTQFNDFKIKATA